MDATRDMIGKIRQAHNLDYDIAKDGPPVTWAEAAIAESIGELLLRLETIEREYTNLLKRIGFLENRLIGFIKYGFRGD